MKKSILIAMIAVLGMVSCKKQDNGYVIVNQSLTHVIVSTTEQTVSVTGFEGNKVHITGSNIKYSNLSAIEAVLLVNGQIVKIEGKK